MQPFRPEVAARRTATGTRVMHRLRRIESVTGRKLTDPRSRLLWQLALLDTHRGWAIQHSA